MRKFKQLSSDQRANIALLLNDGLSNRAIARKLNVNPSTISREIRRNSICCSTDACYGHCPLLKNKSSVCNNCKNKGKCLYTKIFYNSASASELSYHSKHTANSYPRIETNTFKKIDNELYDLVVLKGQSIEAAWHASDVLKVVHPLTLRRWVYMDKVKTKVINLKRKKSFHAEPKYDYSKQKKSMEWAKLPFRTMSDFKQYMIENPNAIVIQTDSVEGKKTDKKAILTIYHKNEKLQIGHLYNRNNSSKEVLNYLKKHTRLMLKNTKNDEPIVYVTDNGCEFALISKLEKLDSRVRVFFARPYCSTDKANRERNHELYRYICPKGHTFDNLTQEKVDEIFSNINSYIRESTQWKSPCELTTRAYGEEFLKQLHLTLISPKDVNLRPLY